MTKSSVTQNIPNNIDVIIVKYYSTNKQSIYYDYI